MQQPVLHLPFDPPRYQYEDYKNWDDEWELIDGAPYSLLPPAGRRHQQLVVRLLVEIQNNLNKDQSNCGVFTRLDWIINDSTVVRPDLMIVTEPIKTNWLQFPPVLIVEIASKATYPTDSRVKRMIYEINGVRYYLLVDVENERIECSERENGFYQAKNDKLFALTENCNIEIDFNLIWT